MGANALAVEMNLRIDHLKAAIPLTPAAGEREELRLREIEGRLDELAVLLTGDTSMATRNEAVPWPIIQRAEIVYGLLLDVRSDVPAMYEDSYGIAATEFADALERLHAIEADLASLEAELEQLGAPHTPGRIPDWSRK